MEMAKKSGMTLVEVLLSASIISIVAASFLGFITIYRENENRALLGSRVDSYLRDRVTVMQLNGAASPVAESNYAIPSSYVGPNTVNVRETADDTWVPAGYSGLSLVTISATWTSSSGNTATREIQFVTNQQ